MIAMAGEARSALLRENEELRERAAKVDEIEGKLGDALHELKGWEGAKAGRLLDPRMVRPGRFANRHEATFAGPEFAQLKAEILNAGGNVQPIKVRPVAADANDAQHEIVFGHRRHRACLELGIPVLALVDSLDDRTMFVEMDRENRGRKDLSAWEQGRMYRRALDSGLFPSARRLADAVGVDLSQVGKALAIADLPEAVVAAFRSPLELQFRWSKLLRDAWEGDPDAVRVRANELAALPVKLDAPAVVARLCGGEATSQTPNATEIEVSVAGKAVAAVTQTRKGTLVSIHQGLVPQARLKELAKVIEGFLSKPASRK